MKKIIVLIFLICLVCPRYVSPSSEHYELHFAVCFTGTYGITKILEYGGFSKWCSRGVAIGTMIGASLYKEYVYDLEPDKNDLFFDGVGIGTALVVLEF